MRVVLFALEYALRYAMAPGRVENWVVLLDLANILEVVSPLHVGSLISTAHALGTALEKVYCGRMTWMRIINVPSLIGRAVNSCIPTEKKEKISCPQDVAAELARHFEPNQLEERYGGTAPNLDPAQTYPFRFFPNCRGKVEAGATTSTSASQEGSLCRSNSSLRDPEVFSLHESTSRAFHEGFLWDASSEAARARWLVVSQQLSLTPEAAGWLSKQLYEGQVVDPCRDLETWLELTNPVARHHSSEWLEESSPSSGKSPAVEGHLAVVGLPRTKEEEENQAMSTPSVASAASSSVILVSL